MTKEQLAKMAGFIKEAFIIDGPVKWDNPHDYKGKEGIVFKCRDSERGMFYIGMYK